MRHQKSTKCSISGVITQLQFPLSDHVHPPPLSHVSILKSNNVQRIFSIYNTKEITKANTNTKENTKANANTKENTKANTNSKANSNKGAA